ncbi:unnamed protein product [Paramecium octaurelia]|uniref:Uncharacterized protein n=1 Tax=Paramecium octaurelia TaxID=43137 RepID=A0A8S1UR04_PAROT|nr:unnamed protein product [Paramecium octaurelia]
MDIKVISRDNLNSEVVTLDYNLSKRLSLLSFQKFKIFLRFIFIVIAEFQTVYVGFISNIPLLIFLCISSPSTELAEFLPLDDQFSYQNQIQIYTNIFFAVLGLLIMASSLHQIDFLNILNLLKSLCITSCLFEFLYASKPFKVKYSTIILLTLRTTLGFVVAIVPFILPQSATWCDLINIKRIFSKGSIGLFQLLSLQHLILDSFSKLFFKDVYHQCIKQHRIKNNISQQIQQL